MKRRISLRHMLARQWMIFSLVLFAGFSLFTVLLLYIVEDSLINRRLRDVAASITTLEAAALPPRFELIAAANAPVALQAPMQNVAIGGIREFRLADSRYVHVLVGQITTGQTFLLSYDVSDQLHVNAALQRALPIGLALAVLLASLAYFLAHRFSNGISEKARTLLTQLARDQPNLENLRKLVENETIVEFSELARLSAQALEQQLAMLDRERETLAFLSHELRTPLQSARNSLALLENDKTHVAAWLRLSRAVSRLTRASQSVLWLSTNTSQNGFENCNATSLLQALLEEMSPLLHKQNQTIHYTAAPVEWQLPEQVAETVIANLLLNAVQHGGSGEIRIELCSHEVCISNPLSVQTSSEGFGLGLVVVQRLLQKFGWQLLQQQHDGRMMVSVSKKNLDMHQTPDIKTHGPMQPRSIGVR